ncbi:DUF6124 family protein [Pseudomonas sp. SZMC_28357]|uniref:DUF6124 family protein n=1 Tax=Pseudomonas sp. SZMC_28357 TaxID=3074380 RepID=UPI002870EBEA|nr:DUF6124 family protein [Pseudomonas sp. SZMC_28357]MDR9750367.1 DUF6124 family protein [Pseudomonas sp. SZMC_28357]
MFKQTPNPPEADDVSPYDSLDPKKLNDAANRALDHYLTPPTEEPTKKRLNTMFIVAPDVDNESLLAHACETLASLNVMASDLAFALEGSTRSNALAIQQMVSLAELVVNQVLDRVDVPDATV